MNPHQSISTAGQRGKPEEAAVALGGKESAFPRKCWLALEQGALPPASLTGVPRAELGARAP